MALEFAGAAMPLTDTDIADAAARLGIEAAVVRAVDEVESRGKGFLPDNRPVISFERHIFGRRTGHRYSATHPDVSGSTPGGYGAPGAHQYERLHEAIKLDRTAALQSASFGRYQVMGFNAELCGWPDVEAFVIDMCKSESLHLQAFIEYCRANDLVRFLATHDWRNFAAGYNGRGNVDVYSQKLEAAYLKHRAAATAPAPGTDWGDEINDPMRPIDALKELQRTLAAAGVYPPELIDGAFGRRSRAALNALLRAANQPGI